MDPTVIVAIIGGVATVTVAIIGAWATIHQKKPKSDSKPIETPVKNNHSPPSKASDLYERGVSSFSRGQYQQALVIVREVEDRAGEGTILNNLGLVYQARGQYDQALQNYQQALVILREVGDKVSEEAVLASIKSLSDS